MMVEKNIIKAAEFKPDLLGKPSAWLGHLPFASWLIGEIRPSCLVELGTHYGHSYFAFCQSASELAIPMKYYGVDTWQGDEHAGVYGEEIYQNVYEYNQKYSRFSSLLRMTFDEASELFECGSIDVLHIDGLHTYEAVKHDFEKWLPKLRAGAIVLFHDANVRDRNFGVWKFWSELCEIYPNNIEFYHSFGLGVVQINNTAKEQAIKWLTPGYEDKKMLINYFAAIGAHQNERYRVIDLEQQICHLNSYINDIKSKEIEIISILDEQRNNYAEIKKTLDLIYSSRTWRYTQWLRWLIGAFRKE